jgi:hypothetical protein
MGYQYTELRPALFTEEGVEMLERIRANVGRCLRESGAVLARSAWTGVTGDSWTMLAALDYMVERGEIREVLDIQGTGFGQHRIFVWGRL